MSDPSRPGAGLHRAPARIVGIYIAFGLLWIWLSDWAIVWMGHTDTAGFLAIAAKGSLFVGVTAILLFWLMRREVAGAIRLESLLRGVVEGTTDAVFVKDRDGRYLLANDAAARVMGRTTDEVLGRHDRDLFDASSAERIVANDRAILDEGRGTTFEETITASSIGETRTYLATKAPFRDSDGRIAGLIGISRDITERKAIEVALGESDARLREAQRIARLGSWSWEPRTGRVQWTAAEYELFGISDTSVAPSFERFLSLVHPDDRPVAIARVEAMLAGSDEFADDLRIVRPDGVCIWVHSRARATRDASGELILVEGIDQDITAMVAAETELRSERDRLEKLMEAVPVAICSFQIGSDGRISMPFASQRIEAVYGIAPEGLEQDASGIFDSIHPDDIERVRATFAEAARTTSLWRDEFRLDRRGPGEIWVEGCAVPSRQPDGSLLWHGYFNDITTRRQADAALRGSERRLRLALEAAGAIAFTWDVPRDVVTRYFSTEPALPVTSQQPVTLDDVRARVHPDDLDEFDANLAACLASGSEYRNSYRVIRPDGTVACLEEYGYLDRDDEGKPSGLTGMSIDVTERKALQTRFIQAQKMEAVGRLAGGVAHDFNNLLTIINGYSELLLMSESLNEERRRESTAAIREAGERASRLTRQLLALGRKAVIEPRVLDLNALVVESTRLLGRLIGEDIAIEVRTTDVPLRVRADAGQLEQVIMNLVLNARDAMPTGGRLTIETAAAERGDDAAPRFARLSVSDTGHGIDEEIRSRIFEPFFTTKELGKGSGLGLAVVDGVVAQSGGTIDIESRIGSGTTFRLSFPLVPNDEARPASSVAKRSERGSETILLVEDEASVRKIARVALESQGYRVLEASGGPAAVRMAESYPGTIDLLISDVVMPEIGGRQLLDAIRARRPGIKVLFMSGYTDDAILLHGVVEATDAFLQKPFTPIRLAGKVRELLDAPPTSH
ncbi:MAG TPA: PAS domain-containing protein [Pirellulaceae bacterium]|nr:PAS domain-containing protein [Pirellulaceae bacterium]